ncbi:PorT family protein [Alistipes sp. OttesenSCG-928-L06]|nr:PorT family protein [Alistipes sp. OttesenSCG-928-L06]
MKKLLPLLLLLYVLPTVVSAQQPLQENIKISDAEMGYYLKDGVIHRDIYLYLLSPVEKHRTLSIPQQPNHDHATFTPDDVNEYGIYNSQIFRSCTVVCDGVPRRVFLEEVANIDHQATVYYHLREDTKEGVYYIFRENHLQRVTEADQIWSLIRETYADGESGSFRFPDKLRHHSIQKINSAYWDRNINLFPQFQYGVTGSLGLVKPRTNGNALFTYDYNAFFTVGLFAQIPLDECFTLRPELLFSRVNNQNDEYAGGGLKVSVNEGYKRSSLQMPVLFRYSFNHSTQKLIPYMEVGPLFDYALGGSKYSDGTQKEHGGNELEDTSSIVPFLWGGSLGAGVEYKISDERSLNIGLRFNHAGGRRSGYYTEKLTTWQLNVSMNILSLRKK